MEYFSLFLKSRKNSVRDGLRYSVASVFLASALCMPVLAQWGGFGGGFGYNRGGFASTAGQAASYGMSETMRAQGFQAIQNSEAAKNWEDVKTKEIDNRQKWTDTYFDMRKTNREARAAENGPQITHDQAIRMAAMGAPPRLISTQLDPVTGHIQYPLVLQDDLFKPYRDELDEMFAKRASSGGSVSFGDLQDIQTTVSKFTDALKEHVDKYPAGPYGQARTFLDSLKHEALMPST